VSQVCGVGAISRQLTSDEIQETATRTTRS
jgi:hypothetical protein